MNKTMSKVAVMVLCMFFLVSGVVFANGEGEKEEGKVAVVYSWWDITKSTGIQELKEGFEAKYADENLKLEFKCIPSKYADKIATIVAGGGDMPDVMMLAMDKVPQFAGANLLKDLNEYISEEKTEDLYGVVKTATTFGGKTYAVCRDVSTMCMYVNTKMLKDAGLEIPSADWTLDEFHEVATKLTKGEGKDKQWGYYFNKHTDTMYSWLYLFGGGLFDNTTNTSLLSNPESIRGIQYAHDMIYKDKIVPTTSEAQQFGNQVYDPFNANKVGMFYGALSMASNVSTDFTVLPLPKAVNGESITHAFVNTWTIPAKAKNPDLSWKVLDYFSSAEGQEIAVRNKMGLPGSKTSDVTEFLSENDYNKYFYEALDYAIPYPTARYGAAYQALFESLMPKIWDNKDVDIKTELEDMDTRLNAKLLGIS